MKSFSDLLFEAKFSNFNSVELAAFKDQLEELTKNNEYLSAIAKNRKSGLAKMRPASDWWVKTHTVPKSDQIEYGSKYLLIFDNPFTNENQLTLDDSDKFSPKPCTTSEEKTIMCIGIADKFKKLHLVNQWGNDCTVQWNNKGIYMKEKTKNEDGFTDVFYSSNGWYLYRKDYPCFYVTQQPTKSGFESMVTTYPVKQNNAFVRLENCIILDISKLPSQFEEIQKEIDKKAKEREELRKKEEARLKAEEDRKKWWKEREGYRDFGCANSWHTTPKELEEIFKDKDAKWYSVTIGRCYNMYFCDKYKVTYTVDSSD